jgi:hypothetical protein
MRTITIDPSRRTAEIDNNGPAGLTNLEIAILQILVSASCKPVSRRDILQAIYGTADRKTRTIDVHISRINTKLQVNGEYPILPVSPRKDFQGGYEMYVRDASMDIPAPTPSGPTLLNPIKRRIKRLEADAMVNLHRSVKGTAEHAELCGHVKGLRSALRLLSREDLYNENFKSSAS